jgi:hypothetical protein
MKHAELTPQACAIATEPQMLKLASLLEKADKIGVSAAGLDLPTGYLFVRIDYPAGPIYGGISPEGDLST